MKALAFDLGASSGRAMLGEIRGGRLRTEVIHRFDNRMVRIAGHLHWNAMGLFEEMKRALAKCAARGERLDSLGVSTWGVDYGLIGKDGGLVGLPYAYRDDRTRGAVDEVEARISRERLYEITGIQFLPFNTIYQLRAAKRDHPNLLAASRAVLTMPELFSYLLSGELAAEYTHASTTGLLDVRRRTWSTEVIEAIEVPERLFPDVVEAGTRLGPLRRDVAGEVGLEVPVMLGACHDTAAAVLAVPASGDGWAYISTGTWSLMGMEIPAPVLTARARDLNFTNEGGVGETIRFLKNVMGLWLIQECRRVWAERGAGLTYDEIRREAGESPAFGPLIDPDDPSFLAPDDMPAAIEAFCRDTDQKPPQGRGAPARCIFESLALKYRFIADRMEGLTGRRIGTLHIVGGGAKNDLLCRMTADALGVEVVAGPVEGASIGNLMVQAMAAGEVGSVAEARSVIGISFPLTEYHPENTEVWDAAYERFRGLMER